MHQHIKLHYLQYLNLNCKFLKNLSFLLRGNYDRTVPLYSITEPGIGAFLIISVGQFIIANLILYLIEKQPQTLRNLNGCFKTNNAVGPDNESVLNNVIKFGFLFFPKTFILKQIAGK